jgi:hypothetical protein
LGDVLLIDEGDEGLRACAGCGERGRAALRHPDGAGVVALAGDGGGEVCARRTLILELQRGLLLVGRRGQDEDCRL